MIGLAAGLEPAPPCAQKSVVAPITQLLTAEPNVIRKSASNPQNDDLADEAPLFQAVHNNDLEWAQQLFWSQPVHGPRQTTLQGEYQSLHVPPAQIVATQACRNDMLLHRAVRCGWYPMVKFLLENVLQDQINTPKRDGATPLFLAAQEGHCGLVQLLITTGAALDLSDEDGISPLYIAAYQGHNDVVEILLEAGADPNQLGKDSTSPLYIASQEGYANIVEMLAERGADINAADREGTTPLLMAAQEGRTASVAVLLSYGSGVDATTSRGVRPVHSAAQNGHLKILQMLTAYGAQTAVTTQSGTTALRLAVDFGHDDVAAWLGRCGGWPPLQICADARLYWVAQRMFESGVANAQLADSAAVLAIRKAALLPGNEESGKACPVTAGLFRRATAPWTPSNHHLFCHQFRATARQLMLVRQRLLRICREQNNHPLSPVLPYEMWLAITSHISRSSYLPPASPASPPPEEAGDVAFDDADGDLDDDEEGNQAFHSPLPFDGDDDSDWDI